MNKIIVDLRNKLERSKDREKALREALDEANSRIETLKSRVKDLETDNANIREEIRRLRHFRVQQEELYGYLNDYAEKHEVEPVDMGNYPRPQLDSSVLGDLVKEFSFLRQKSKLTLDNTVTRQKSKLNLGARQSSKLSLGPRQGSKLSRQNTKMGLGSRQPTKIKIENRDAAVTRMHLVQQQVNILSNKMFYMQYNILEWQSEEKRIQAILTKTGLDKSYLKEMKKILIDIKKEKKVTKAWVL